MEPRIAEFLTALHNTVKLPDCRQDVEIRRIWQLDLVGAGELALPPEEEGNRREATGNRKSEEGSNEAEAILKRCRRIICAGAVSPPFYDGTVISARCVAGSAIDVRELSQGDFFFLATVILEFSGLTREVKAQADSFRPDGVGGDGAVARGEIRETSERDT